MHVLDLVIDQIDSFILSQPPESGGALMGLPGVPVITHFLPDPAAHTTTASYRASDALRAQISELETVAGLEHKGIIHSHPARFARPSAQDLVAFCDSLELNPHLATYVTPIAVQAGVEGDHITATRQGSVAWWQAQRTAGSDSIIECVQVVPTIVPVGEFVRYLADSPSVALNPDPFAKPGSGAHEIEVSRGVIAGAESLVVELDLSVGGSCTLAIASGFPLIAPIIFVTPDAGACTQVNVAWPLDSDLADLARRAVEAIDAAVATGAVREGLEPNDATTGAESIDPVEPNDARIGDLFVRNGELLGDHISEAQVLIAGLGSVGSVIAMGLARAGVGRFVLIDDDVVEAANLSRSDYVASDIGLRKVEALEQRLRSVNPEVAVEHGPSRVEAAHVGELRRLIGEADLAIAATDDPAAQRLMNALAHHEQIMSVYPALYQGAKGGEIVIVVPELSACYQCATAPRHSTANSKGTGSEPSDEVDIQATRVVDLDYGTGRLKGEIALGCDIAHVSTAATRVAVSLLCLSSSAPAGQLALDAVAGGSTYLAMSIESDYWYFPAVFADTPAQHGFQSVWMSPERSPDCPVCGDNWARVDPTDLVTNRPAIERVQEIASNDEGAGDDDGES